MKKYILFNSILLCSLLLSGCATILQGTKQTLTITSDPSGAEVSDGRVEVITPATIELERDRDHVLTITKPGFEPETVKVQRVLGGATPAYIVMPGGFLLWGIDAISGAQWNLEPDHIEVDLKSEQPKEAPSWMNP